MTREEFNHHSFGSGQSFIYKGESFPLASVDFEEGLIGLDTYDDINDCKWVRCENAILVEG